jgi:hypothetical protein
MVPVTCFSDIRKWFSIGTDRQTGILSEWIEIDCGSVLGCFFCEEGFSKGRSLRCVTFECGCRLERIEESGFSGSALKWIAIPSSVVVLGKSSFSGCSESASECSDHGEELTEMHAPGYQPLTEARMTEEQAERLMNRRRARDPVTASGAGPQET